MRLAGADRVVISSRAKLACDEVADADLPPGFADLAARIQAAEDRRGAIRVDSPEQEVVALGDGHFDLHFQPRLVAEAQKAALSLAANLAIAAAMQEHRTGLFRVMARAESRSARIGRAAVDRAQKVMLASAVGRAFVAAVTDADERGARIQPSDLPVVARADAHRVQPGDLVRVRLTAVDPGQRALRFASVE